jgi:hypothetical protein
MVPKTKELGWEAHLHPPYSPDSAPSDLHLLKSAVHFWKDVQFNNFEEGRKWVRHYLASQPHEYYTNDNGIMRGS